MKITATVENRLNYHHAEVATDGNHRDIAIPIKKDGYGSLINGGELLFLSLATCFCNDIYREAMKRNIVVHSVHVDVSGEFGFEGEPAKSITYSTQVTAEASDDDIARLIAETDKVAEIHNTLRIGVPVLQVPS